MNTPEPCCRCKYCVWDCMKEDDPTDEAWCELGLDMGDMNCRMNQRGER